MCNVRKVVLVQNMCRTSPTSCTPLGDCAERAQACAATCSAITATSNVYLRIRRARACAHACVRTFVGRARMGMQV